MDSVTHVVLGAVTGELIAGKKLGRKAWWLGAAANSLPDIDFVAGIWATPSDDFLIHRGITHSFLFAVLAAFALTWMARRLWPGQWTFSGWLFLFGVQLLLHDLLDACNAYGTGWWEPFSHARVSFNFLFVADPLITVPLIIGTAALFLSVHRRRWAWISLTVAAFYLVVASVRHSMVLSAFERQLAGKRIKVEKSFVTPTPLNTWLWFTVARTSEGYFTGFRSILDSEDPDLAFFPRGDSLLMPYVSRQDVQTIITFSQGYYVTAMNQDRLVLSDLRFGQNGWDDPRAPFVFQYDILAPESNALALQRGRLEGMGEAKIRSMWRRMRGIKAADVDGSKK